MPSSSEEATTAWSPPRTWAAPDARRWSWSAAKWWAAAPSPKKSGRASAFPPPPISPAFCRNASSAISNCARFGYQVDAKDPAFFSPFPDGRCFFMWQDGRKTLDEIAKFSQARRRSLSRIRSPARAPVAGRGIAAADHSAAISAARRRRFDRVSEAARDAAQACAPRKSWRWSRSSRKAPPSFSMNGLNRRELKVTLATDGVIGANGGPRSPGTAYILMHHVMGSVAGHRGLWGFVRGGMGAVSEAIADRPRAATARPSAPTRAVEKILVRDGRARGVVLEGGEEIEAHDGGHQSRSAASRFCACSTSAILPPDFVDRHPPLPHRRHILQDQSGAHRPARIQRPPRRARPAASRHHAHLPVDRIHRARLG